MARERKCEAEGGAVGCSWECLPLLAIPAVPTSPPSYEHMESWVGSDISSGGDSHTHGIFLGFGILSSSYLLAGETGTYS